MSAAQRQIDLFRPVDVNDAANLLFYSFPNATMEIKATFVLPQQVSYYTFTLKPSWKPWTWMKAIYKP